MGRLLQLDDGTILAILKYLELRSLAVCACTCSAIRSLCWQNSLYTAHAVKRFGLRVKVCCRSRTQTTRYGSPGVHPADRGLWLHCTLVQADGSAARGAALSVVRELALRSSTQLPPVPAHHNHIRFQALYTGVRDVDQLQRCFK
jgi:hypothetical protein